MILLGVIVIQLLYNYSSINESNVVVVDEIQPFYYLDRGGDILCTDMYYKLEEDTSDNHKSYKAKGGTDCVFKKYDTVGPEIRTFFSIEKNTSTDKYSYMNLYHRLNCDRESFYYFKNNGKYQTYTGYGIVYLSPIQQMSYTYFDNNIDSIKNKFDSIRLSFDNNSFGFQTIIGISNSKMIFYQNPIKQDLIIADYDGFSYLPIIQSTHKNMLSLNRLFQERDRIDCEIKEEKLSTSYYSNNILTSMHNISRSHEKFIYNNKTSSACFRENSKLDSLKFTYDIPILINKINPEPDELCKDKGFRYTDSSKLSYIKNNGLYADISFPKYEGLQSVRIFICSFLLTTILTFIIKNLLSSIVVPFWKVDKITKTLLRQKIKNDWSAIFAKKFRIIIPITILFILEISLIIILNYSKNNQVNNINNIEILTTEQSNRQFNSLIINDIRNKSFNKSKQCIGCGGTGKIDSVCNACNGTCKYNDHICQYCFGETNTYCKMSYDSLSHKKSW